RFLPSVEMTKMAVIQSSHAGFPGGNQVFPLPPDSRPRETIEEKPAGVKRKRQRQNMRINITLSEAKHLDKHHSPRAHPVSRGEVLS
ncbi:MAG TPA: hypothetical protein PLA58_07735, partial [Smithellaceae bacterium]|nr:hypothetical protein [Smithellaceae bacterium]HOR62721.1 hypothetical protein [Smithellaceae bacterium]